MMIGLNPSAERERVSDFTKRGRQAVRQSGSRKGRHQLVRKSPTVRLLDGRRFGKNPVGPPGASARAHDLGPRH